MMTDSSSSSPHRAVARRTCGRWLVRLALLVGWSWPAVAGARPPTHVACVGDSITFGYEASSPSASYPSDLQKMFGSSVSVMNFGHSGATMLSTGDLPYQKQSEYTAATSFVSGAGAGATVAVVLMLGTNDSKPQNWMSGSSTRATQFQTDAAALVDHFAQLGTRPTVYLAIPPRIYTNTYGIDGTVMEGQIDPILLNLATSKGLPLIDFDAPTAGHPELFSDGVHPTDAGYMLLATIVHDALVSGGGGAGEAGGAGTSGGGGRGATGSGGASAGGHGGATIGAGGSGGTSGTGGAGTGGLGSGGANSGGTSAGTGGLGSGGMGTGGVTGGGTGGTSTGGVRAASGGQSAPATGGSTASASGGSGGATTATGGTPAGGGETNGAQNGCACALNAGSGSCWPSVALGMCALLMTRARRRRGRG